MRIMGGLLASAYLRTVFLWMSNSLAIARMERPRSLACCTAFHRTLCHGVGFLRGDAGGLRTLPSPFNVALSASMTPRDAKLSLGWLPTPLTLRSRARRRLLCGDRAASDFRALVAKRTPGFGARNCRVLCGLRGGAHRKGMPPSPGSLAERVALTGRAASAEADAASGNVAVAARPVLWRGRLAKVAVVAVPYRDRAVLSPQLGQASFERIPQACQVIRAGVGRSLTTEGRMAHA